jgi:hypothetical protein
MWDHFIGYYIWESLLHCSLPCSTMVVNNEWQEGCLASYCIHPMACSCQMSEWVVVIIHSTFMLCLRRVFHWQLAIGGRCFNPRKMWSISQISKFRNFGRGLGEHICMGHIPNSNGEYKWNCLHLEAIKVEVVGRPCRAHGLRTQPGHISSWPLVLT